MMAKGQGRKSRPTVFKILEGEKNKNRINMNEPEFPDAGAGCPDHLDLVARREWERLVPDLRRVGLLTTVDVAALAAYCQSYSRWVAAETQLRADGLVFETKNGDPKPNPFILVADRALAQMYRYLTEFGMTPSARTRVSAKDASKQNNAISEFLD